jgi:hypothetical protein
MRVGSRDCEPDDQPATSRYTDSFAQHKYLDSGSTAQENIECLLSRQHFKSRFAFPACRRESMANYRFKILSTRIFVSSQNRHHESRLPCNISVLLQNSWNLRLENYNLRLKPHLSPSLHITYQDTPVWSTDGTRR